MQREGINPFAAHSDLRGHGRVKIVDPVGREYRLTAVFLAWQPGVLRQIEVEIATVGGDAFNRSESGASSHRLQRRSGVACAAELWSPELLCPAPACTHLIVTSRGCVSVHHGAST